VIQRKPFKFKNSNTLKFHSQKKKNIQKKKYFQFSKPSCGQQIVRIYGVRCTLPFSCCLLSLSVSLAWSYCHSSKMTECCIFNLEWLSRSKRSSPRSKATGETQFFRRVMIHYHLNIQLSTTLSMWQGGPPL
jgi:hypothetical protein